MTEYLSGLNKPQREAVEHVKGPILVLAGAGSGKTRVLTTRIAHLVREHGTDPDKILAVTFTNKAAEEMRGRIGKITPGAERVHMSTFHAFGARFLRRHSDKLGWPRGFSILDADDCLKEISRIMKERPVRDKEWTPQMMRKIISDFKNELLDPSKAKAKAFGKNDLLTQEASEIYVIYQAGLQDTHSADFDDLLRLPVELLEGHEDLREYYAERYEYVLIDEYQDTNKAQYELIRFLAGRKRNLMVVGDDDQAIYGWRGASLRNILDFERDFSGAGIIRLEQNYRSTGCILDVANAVICKNKDRKGKTLWTGEGHGEKIQLHVTSGDREEARLVVEQIQQEMSSGKSAREIAILYRTNAQSRQMEHALKNKGVLYNLIGGVSFYERKEIKDVLAYTRLLVNPRDNIAFSRAVNTPKRGVGEKSINALRQAAKLSGAGLLEVALGATKIEGMPKKAGLAVEEMAKALHAMSQDIDKKSVVDILEDIIGEFELEAEYKKDVEKGEERLENLNSLISEAAEFIEDKGEGGRLEQFLERAVLMSDIDMVPDTDKVSLMTLHSAKGLEYEVVYLVGMEEGLFPHSRSIGNSKQLEEERRLFYVGITRAKEKCVITMAKMRRLGAEQKGTAASSFLKEIPSEMIAKREHYSTNTWSGGQKGWQRRTQKPAYTKWGGQRDEIDQEDSDNIDWVDSPKIETAKHIEQDAWQGKQVRILGEEGLGVGEVKISMGAGAGLKAVVVFPNGQKRTVGVEKLTISGGRSLRQ